MEKIKNLKNIVHGLVTLSVAAFLAGFLQDTEFEFVIYTLYFIWFVVGVKLVVLTLKSNTSLMLKTSLLLTGLSSTIYFLFFAFAFTNNLLFGTDVTEIMEKVEDMLYLTSLVFLISIIGSIVLFEKK